jgi:tetraacyldisaccharide-1-P 4'-kinase
LREPVRGLRRADAVIVTRSDQISDRCALERTIFKHADIPVFYAHHEMTKMRRLADRETIIVSDLARKRVAAFSGIARPERFITDLSNLGIKTVQRFDFPDHHRYEPDEFLNILKRAQEAEVEAIVTTEKDAANLTGLPRELLGQSAIPIYAAQIEFRCETIEELKSFVLDKISTNRT